MRILAPSARESHGRDTGGCDKVVRTKKKVEKVKLSVRSLAICVVPVRILAVVTIGFVLAAFVAGRVCFQSRVVSKPRSLKDAESRLPLLPPSMNDPIDGSQSAIADFKSDGTLIERRSAKDAVSPELVHDSQKRRDVMKNSPYTEGSRNQHSRAMDAREELFAEALVHPVMLAHRYPKRVAVVGGTAETLSEILKHTTVEQVYLFEDAYSLSEQRMGTLSQFDDDQRVHRIQVDHAELPLALHRHSTSAGAYDVIVWTRRVADGLLLDRASSLLADSLSSAGILGIAELRTRSESTTVPEVLEHTGFESLVRYSDDGKIGVWVAMKDVNARSFWFGRSQAESERDMRLRLSASSLSSLRVSDSPGIMRYKFPTRISEAIWCAKNGFECMSGHGYNPHIPNVPISSIYVKRSGMGDKAGRGLFTRVPIRQGSRIGMEMCVHNMYIPPPMYSLLTAMHRQIGGLWKPFLGYIRWYGWIDTNYGQLNPSAGADACITTFINHGCNGTYNTGWAGVNVTELTAVPGLGPEANGYGTTKGEAEYDERQYNPFLDRFYPGYDCDDSTPALRDIDAGEELFDNYLDYAGTDRTLEWEVLLQTLKTICAGEAGPVTVIEGSGEVELM